MKEMNKKKWQQKKRVAKDHWSENQTEFIEIHFVCACIPISFLCFIVLTAGIGEEEEKTSKHTDEEQKKLIQMRLGVWSYYTSTIAMYHFDFNYFTSIHERRSAHTHTHARACKHRQILRS